MGSGASVHAYLASPLGYSHEAWGSVDASTARAAVDIILTDFDAAGVYSVPSITMIDDAGNRTTYVFSDAPGHEPTTKVTVATTNPDGNPPEISLNDVPELGLHPILVSASPTHPDAPDGETVVTIRYQARDDKSGLGSVSYRLLDPQGISHFQYHYHGNFYTTFFQGDPRSGRNTRFERCSPSGRRRAPGVSRS